MVPKCFKPALLALTFICPIAISATPSLEHMLRQLPANATGVKTIHSPSGATIRYKEPGKEGVCETTKGVNSYSGYIDISPTSHTFFWFFEARKNPEKAPLTLWLNGGPGSDSMIGLFQELGPCNVTADLKTEVNPYSWNEVSNMLFISQPLGVGFSYSEEQAGTLNPYTGEQENATFGGVDGRYPHIDADLLSTTDLAAAATWHILQGFLDALPQLDAKASKSKLFNLWTESYGGHYGPAFFDYFRKHNEAIAVGTEKGIHLTMDTLGIGNGIINEAIQVSQYPEFAVNNTYGIKAVNDTVYNYMKFANEMPGGCQDQISECNQVNRTTDVGQIICMQATDQCRTNVEQPYYEFSGRGTYDIRHPYNDPTPPSYFEKYLNTPFVQNALGVDLNYTSDSNSDVFYAFTRTGDFVYPNFIDDLADLLNNNVRVALFYGDADYICNWFGGEAASLGVNYTHAADFAKAGYAPFTVSGTEYGEVRQHGNFSFTRIYEAGHEVPFYQPKAALEMFKRVLGFKDIATGEKDITADYGTEGDAHATHTEPFVAIPSFTGLPQNVPEYTGVITGPLTEVPGSVATAVVAVAKAAEGGIIV